MTLTLPQGGAAAAARLATKLGVVSVAALATFACGDKQPAPSNAPSNSNTVHATAALPTDLIPNLGVKYQPEAGVTYTRGVVIVEANLPTGMTLDSRLVIKKPSGDITKSIATIPSGKSIVTIPLTAADLQNATEVNWKETQVDPAQWKLKRYRMVEPTQIGGHAYVAESEVTDLGEIECCPQTLSDRGIFTTPIGLRVYLLQ
jgi:hypothetical protein